MKLGKTITILLNIIFLSHITFAQYPENRAPNNPPPDYVYRNEQKRREMDAFNGKDENGMIKRTPDEARSSVPTINRSPVSTIYRKENQAEKLRIIAEINAKFHVPDSYRNKYTEFLKQKNTGIARMFPDTKCDAGLTVTVEELQRCANTPQVIGSGSRYSLRFREIPSNYPLDFILGLFESADIYYNDEKIIVGSAYTQSVISEIGNIELETLDSKSDAFNFLRSFKPSKSNKDIKAQNKVLGGGIKSNGYTYSNSVPVKLNSTYVFRSIAFSVMVYPAFWQNDILAAFKIVGKEDDGSIIFIWKNLKQKESPSLKIK